MINPINSVAVGVLEQVEPPQMSIFPNPTSEGIHVVSQSEIAVLSIYDMTGKLVKEQTPDRQETYIHLDVPNGIYIVQVRTAQGTAQKKMVKQ